VYTCRGCQLAADTASGAGKSDIDSRVGVKLKCLPTYVMKIKVDGASFEV
jgi:hypothetical protein